MACNAHYDLLSLSLAPPHSLCISYSDHLEIQGTAFIVLAFPLLILGTFLPRYFHDAFPLFHQASIGIVQPNTQY